MDSGQDAGALAAAAQAGGEEEPAAAAGPPEDAGPAGDSEPAGDTWNSADPAETAGPAGAPVWTAAMAVLLVLLVAGLAAAGFFLIQVRGADAASARRQAVLAAARHAVADLTTADYRHPRQFVSRLKADGTGRFLSLFTNSATGFTNVLVRGQVETVGHVAEAGVQQLGTDTAEVSVLAYVTVKNAQTPNGTQRVYRMTIWLISAGSRWLVSNVEFVK